MKPFTRHSGIAAAILVDNVDTDQIIPSREMKRVSKSGLGEGLFAGWRYVYDGGERTGENADFVLNDPEFRSATILLGGANFGCGSSREHAVWALADFGIRAVIASGFGRIFRNNCARNGLLAIELPSEHVERIAALGATPVDIDLEACRLTLSDGTTIDFDVPPADRDMLLQGLDYIDFALRYANDIEAFIERDRKARPWAYRESAEVLSG